MAIDRRALFSSASKTLAAAMIVPGSEVEKQMGRAIAGVVGITGNGADNAEVALPWDDGMRGNRQAERLARMNLRVRSLRESARRELRRMKHLDPDIAQLTSCSDAYKWHLQSRRVIDETAAQTLEDWACYEHNTLSDFFAQYGLKSFLGD